MPSDFIFFSCLVRPSIVYRWYGKTILNRSSLFSWPQDLIWVSVWKMETLKNRKKKKKKKKRNVESETKVETKGAF